MALKTVKITKEIKIKESSNIEPHLWLIVDDEMFDLDINQILELKSQLDHFINYDILS